MRRPYQDPWAVTPGHQSHRKRRRRLIERDWWPKEVLLKAAPTPFRRPLSAARLTQCARLRREACHIQFGTLLAAVGPQMTSYDRCQPRQCEEASQKDILLIRRTSRIGPAERHLLRSDW